MQGQFKFQPSKRGVSSSSLYNKKQQQQEHLSDTVAAKIKRSKRQLSTKEDPISPAYTSLFLFYAIVTVLLVGDGYFMSLYNSVLLPPSPSVLSPFCSHCLVDDTLLHLRILTPADESLTTSSIVSVTAQGQALRPPESSYPSSREGVLVRVLLDDKELSFPGVTGGNLTAPLDNSFRLSFDLAFFGLGSRRSPYKLAVEVLLPVLSWDAHSAQCPAHTQPCSLLAAHTVHFFHVPVSVDGEVGQQASLVPLQSHEVKQEQGQPRQQPPPEEQSQPFSSARTDLPGHSGEEASKDGDAEREVQTTLGRLQDPLVLEDSSPGFRRWKMLSLSHRGSCSARDRSITLEIHMHPEVLAQVHFGGPSCLPGLPPPSAVCAPATVVLSYLGTNHDISEHIRAESISFRSSEALQKLGGASRVESLRLPPVGELLLTLEGVGLGPEPSWHLLLVYVCAGRQGEVEVSEQQRLHDCTQTPAVWDSVFVPCDAA